MKTRKPRWHHHALAAVPILSLVGILVIGWLLGGKSFDAAFGSGATWIATVVTLLLVVLDCVITWLALAERAELDGSTRIINALREDDRHADQGSLQAIMRGLPKNRMFREQWQEFWESLVEVDGRYFNTEQADHFFKDETFLLTVGFKNPKGRFSHAFQDVLSFSVAGIIPATLTSVGLLGTFWGVSSGLGSIDALAEIEQQRDQLAHIIGGLSTAFWTSIVGLGTALVCNVINHILESNLLASLSQFREAIDRFIHRKTSEGLLHEQLGEVRRHGRESERRRGEFSAIASQQLGELHGSRQEADARGVDQLRQLQAIHEEVADARGYLQTIVTDLGEMIGQRFDDTISRLLVPALVQLAGAVESQVTRAADASVESARSFACQLSEQLTGELVGSFTGMAESVQSFGAQFGAATERLERLVGLLETNLHSQVDAMKHSLAVSKFAQQRSDAASELVEQLPALLERTEALRATTTELQRTQAEAQQVASKYAMEFSIAVSEGARMYAESADLLRGTLGSLSQVFGALTKAVDGAVNASERAGERLSEATTKLGARVDAETHLLLGYEEAAGRFGQAMRDGRGTLDGIGEFCKQLNLASATLKEQMVTAELALGRLNSASAALDKSMAEGAASLGASAQAISMVSGNIEGWAGNASAAIQKFGADLEVAVRGSLTAYDGSLTSAVRHLIAAMENMREVADDIADAAHTRN